MQRVRLREKTGGGKRSPRLVVLSKRREEHDVADGSCVGEQHHKTVNTDAAPAGRRQAVFQSTDEVIVVIHGFVVTLTLGIRLSLKTPGLVFGIIQF